jgi:hypothetical protein
MEYTLLLQIDVGDIGAIFKIHLYFGGEFTGTPWFLNKVSHSDLYIPVMLYVYHS